MPASGNHKLVKIAMFGEPKRGPAPPQAVRAELEGVQAKGIETCGKQLSPSRICGAKTGMRLISGFPNPKPLQGISA